MNHAKDILQMKPVLNDPWFEVYELGKSTYAISEPYHFQEVISYLIIGEQQSLLWDTGMNIADIRRVVNQLTNKPLVVVNSHVHFDHIGNNSLFDQVYAYDLEMSLMRYRRGYSNSEMQPQIKQRLFSRIPEDFDVSSFHIPPSSPKPVKDGHLFKLGNRELEVIRTPGHSPDSIMLFDRKNEMLFTGDTYYPGMLYAHFDGDMYGKSDIPTYAESLEKACKLKELIKTVHPSHNKPAQFAGVLCNAAEAMRALAENKLTGVALTPEEMSDASLPDPDEQVEGYVIPEKLYKYEFNGFSIIAGDVNLKVRD